MNNHFDPSHEMGLQDFFTWRSQTTAAMAQPTEDEDIQADVDEPPDHRSICDQTPTGFHKAIIRPQAERKESLLTKAFQNVPENETGKSDIRLTTDLTRPRSMMSTASLASTAELTSDGGLTSPARTNTPSPPLPRSTYTSFAPYSFASKTAPPPPTPLITKVDFVEPVRAEVLSVSPKAQPVDEIVVKKRCITFMCDGKKGMAKPKQAAVSILDPTSVVKEKPAEAPQPRKCTIKFACTAPKPSDKAPEPTTPVIVQAPTAVRPEQRVNLRSSSIPRKSPKAGLSSPKSTRESSATTRRSSPATLRSKPKYIIADEKNIQSSESTRFHEFASEELQDDDWIRKDADIHREKKLTINDTLKMENAIRQLGNEAEQEALEDEEDDDDDENVNDSDSENDSEDDEEADEDELEDSIASSDEGSDGNETDNEAGFAESDDESDGDGDFAFWTPGRKAHHHGEASIYRPSAHRTASTSSIDSLNHMEPPKKRRTKGLAMKIRPGTPELPDSTDFVCGTLDEDRPLEDAYVSCIAAKKAEKHKQTPQDIDPSFPTSDIDDEEDEIDQVDAADESEDQVWLHGKFEESDSERHGRRRSTTTRRKSPPHSPKRFHSPPPKQTRHRSPPPRKLFGHSPRRLRSPAPPRHVSSPQASPETSKAIPFAMLASRPGLTHTKSLPRTPNAFCRQYHASRLIAANGNNEDAGENDAHVRGAIDIVKGLEQKRQRRKEKFYQKQCNRKGKNHNERRPQPGKGAERMRELGLLMAGKTGPQDPYMLSA